MYLSEVYAENFRLFGSREDNQHLQLSLQPGLNVLVGENESGKSAVVDAVRYLLWTTARDYQRLVEDDFHVSGTARASHLMLRCKFSDLTRREVGRYLEWLTVEGGKPYLYITLTARRLHDHATSTRWRRNVTVAVTSGRSGQGPAIQGSAREFLRTTYLRPLRDAEAELSAGRGSRLSQILQCHPNFGEQGESDFDEQHPEDCVPSTIVGIMRSAEYQIEQTPVIRETQTHLNTEYLREFSIADDVLQGQIGLGRRAELRDIMEKLDLWLRPRPGVEMRTPRGLGVNNALFMATELLLLGGEDQEVLPMLLVEEPEAHLHPQMQLRLMEFLESRSDESGVNPVQILVTTHSPNLASKAKLDRVTIMCNGRPYSLAPDCTVLDSSDYRFLERFLDVTRANLFFAKGVLLVEGPSENILLPALASLIGCSLSRYGVSIVNVASRAFLRYARIFKRTDDRAMPVRVACVVDRDVVPDSVDYVDTARKESQFSREEVEAHMERLRDNDGDLVRTFVSDHWTLEYDLARAGLSELVHKAVSLAKKARGSSGRLNSEDQHIVLEEAMEDLAGWHAEGLDEEAIAASVYKPLHEKSASKPETAQFLAQLLEESGMGAAEIRGRLPLYIVEALEYVTSTDEGQEVPDAAQHNDF
jgi:putative ATP-dependent endonuclease of OLD family